MVTFVVAQLPFREEESAEDYQQYLFAQAGIEPTIREIDGSHVVVAVVEVENMDQARAMNRLLQELVWDGRTPEVISSQQPNIEEAPKANVVPVTVGITTAVREETEKEKAYREAYRKTEAFKEAQKRYQQSSEGRSAQRRYEQSDNGKEARKKYFQSYKYKASRQRYQEKRKMRDMSCPGCGDQLKEHPVQEHVLVETSRALKVHERSEEVFVVYKEVLASEWVSSDLVRSEV